MKNVLQTQEDLLPANRSRRHGDDRKSRELYLVKGVGTGLTEWWEEQTAILAFALSKDTKTKWVLGFRRYYDGVQLDMWPGAKRQKVFNSILSVGRDTYDAKSMCHIFKNHP